MQTVAAANLHKHALLFAHAVSWFVCRIYLPNQTAGACMNLQQDAVMACLGHADCLDRFCHGANLVDLEQQGIAGLLLNGCLHPFWIGAQQVITNHLHQETAGVPVKLFQE